jgi:hypothetical protein
VRFPRITVVLLLIVGLALPLAAQSPNGTINGLVLDPSNRAITGAGRRASYVCGCRIDAVVR